MTMLGREGVAHTFVTPEEGPELTRIEILINRLLKRDEIEGFSTIVAVASATPAHPDGGPAAPAEEEKPKPPQLPGARRGRRHRRAL